MAITSMHQTYYGISIKTYIIDIIYIIDCPLYSNIVITSEYNYLKLLIQISYYNITLIFD